MEGGEKFRKTKKELKKILGETDAAIVKLETAKKNAKPEGWTVFEEGILVLLRCFKYVWEQD